MSKSLLKYFKDLIFKSKTDSFFRSVHSGKIKISLHYGVSWPLKKKGDDDKGFV